MRLKTARVKAARLKAASEVKGSEVERKATLQWLQAAARRMDLRLRFVSNYSMMTARGVVG